MRSKMNILGINMDCLSYADMHRIFNVWLSDKESRSHSLALINVNCCVSALFDKRLVNLYNRRTSWGSTACHSSVGLVRSITKARTAFTLPISCWRPERKQRIRLHLFPVRRLARCAREDRRVFAGTI